MIIIFGYSNEGYSLELQPDNKKPVVLYVENITALIHAVDILRGLNESISILFARSINIERKQYIKESLQKHLK